MCYTLPRWAGLPMFENLLKIALCHGGKIAQIMAKIATFQTKNDDILTLFPREKVEKVES